MLSQFPQERPEESTYSIFARLQFALQPTSLGIMGNMLFNNPREVGRLNFQNSFDYLCDNLPTTFTPELFFYNKTIFPLFIPFLSVEKQKQSLQYFKGVYPGKINKYLVLNNINRKKIFIRVCKECIKEDFHIYGEPYYRRQHEIELNKMCYKHQIPLYEYTISKDGTPRKYENFYAISNKLKEIIIPMDFKEKCLNITNDINTIFKLDLSNWNIEITKNKISNRLIEKGYLTVNGFKYLKKVCEAFKEYYSEEFLNYIGYNFETYFAQNWLTTFFRSCSSDPLKSILFIRFLFGSFEAFYKYPSYEFSVFKKGPYPCLNSICPNYNKLVIENITKTCKVKATQIATFKCTHCGFTYCRRGPDRNDSDIYRKTAIKNRGHLWESKLKECINNDLSLRAISTQLNCDYHTIFNYVRSYKYPNHNNKIQPQIRPDDLLIQDYKNEVLRLIKENPNTNRQTIFNLNKKIYKYLIRNDNSWISTVIPFRQNNNISNDERLKNYWLNKDEILSKELLKAINKIKAEKIPYKRLTLYTLKKHIGYHDLYKNRNKLPKCFEILNKVCETILDYQKRRVNHVIKKLTNNNTKITVIKVLRGASLGVKENVEPEILSYVEMIVSEYNKGNINIINDDK